MSRIIGDCLVAGGVLNSDAEAGQRALNELLYMVHIYGWPKDRGSYGCVYCAIMNLSPAAMRCIEEHGAGEAYNRFCSSYEPEAT